MICMYLQRVKFQGFTEGCHIINVKLTRLTCSYILCWLFLYGAQVMVLRDNGFCHNINKYARAVGRYTENFVLNTKLILRICSCKISLHVHVFQRAILKVFRLAFIYHHVNFVYNVCTSSIFIAPCLHG